jgi:hypothetical protein
MDGLDLLLAVGDTVEKVHQSAWCALLKHSEFLAELGLTSSYEREVVWEPSGGIFDLKAVTDDGPVWIELKIDSELSQAQVRRQFDHAKNDRVVHALLGFADIRSRPWAETLIHENKGTLLNGARVVEALRRVQQSNAATPAAKQLARAYAGQLAEIGQRGSDFRTTSKWCNAHSLSFYERLRRECPDLKNATVTYVANPAGGFEACYWGWINVGDGVECYLQWEDQKLRFKLSVDDRDKCQSVRSAAVEFLRERRLGEVEISRPKRLGSGQTMTVGTVYGLPVQESGGSWEALIAAVREATRVNEALAQCLRGHPVRARE